MRLTKAYITDPTNIPDIATAATPKAAIVRPTKHFQVVSEDNPDMVTTIQKQQEFIAAEIAKHPNLTHLEELDIIQKLQKEFQDELSAQSFAEQMGLIQALQEHEIPIKEILEDKTSASQADDFSYFTDQVFATDVGQYYEESGKLQFIPANFKNLQRLDEERLATSQAKNIGAKVKPLLDANGNKIIFEGGDIRQMVGKKLFFVGHGHRNSAAAGQAIANASGYIVIPISLQQEQFYHLDCCFLPLPFDTAMIYEGQYVINAYGEVENDINGWPLIIPGTETMCQTSRALIRSIYPNEKLVTISHDEALAYATNAVILQSPTSGRYKLFVNGKREMSIFSEHSAILDQTLSLHYLTIQKIMGVTGNNMDVIEVPYKTMHSSGGSVRCTVLELACANENLTPHHNNQYYFSTRADALEQQLNSSKVSFFKNASHTEQLSKDDSCLPNVS